MRRSLLAAGVIVVVVTAFFFARGLQRQALSNRMLDRWTGSNEQQRIELQNDANPDVLYIDPKSVRDGQPKFLPKPAPVVSESSALLMIRDQLAEPTITTSWPHGTMTNTLGTPHRQAENGDSWADRHWAAVDVIRNRQKGQ